MDSLISELTEAATLSVRTSLLACLLDQDLMGRITAPGMVALRRMAKTIEINEDGDLKFASDEDAHWWAEWRTGSSRSNPIGIEQRVIDDLTREVLDVIG